MTALVFPPETYICKRKRTLAHNVLGVFEFLAFIYKVSRKSLAWAYCTISRCIVFQTLVNRGFRGSSR